MKDMKNEKNLRQNNDRDGIRLSDKPVWEMSFRFHLIVLLKRMIALPSKMIGFKPLCLYLATWLLVEKHIGQWAWLAVLMMVLFGIVGLKIAGRVLSPPSFHNFGQGLREGKDEFSDQG